MHQDMLLIAPDQAELWRQAGVMNQRLERVAAAGIAISGSSIWCRRAGCERGAGATGYFEVDVELMRSGWLFERKIFGTANERK